MICRKLNLNCKTTFNYFLISTLILSISTSLSAAPSSQSPPKKEEKNWQIPIEISRSTSLVDHQDGTRVDSLDIQIAPQYKFDFGVWSSVIGYSKDLHDQEGTESDFTDIPTSLSITPYTTKLTPELNFKINNRFTLILPASKNSSKKDELITSTILGISFNLIDLPKSSEDFSWRAGLGLTLGRNFHHYEEDINGQVLNQYSSNQTLNLALSYFDFELSVDYAHRVRWSYYGTVKEYFSISEELNYSFNNLLSFGIGHTNEGSALKPNGYESNFSLFNENDSTVYAKIGLLF